MIIGSHVILYGPDADSDRAFLRDVLELAAKGATFGDVTEARWGRLTQLNLPSGNHVGLYEPHHPLAIDL